ncbi:MAG: hypothetical protein DDT19_00865 [Syntrophomonadaceae bacterium]|nr:hypothetical protein [Bacillota bacterium]
MEDKKKPPTQPWKPASYLKVSDKYRKPGYRLRWVNKDILEKRAEEGWTPVSKVSGASDKIAPEKTIIDGKQIDTTVQKRTLILCEMPEEVAQARDKFYADLTDSGIEAMKSRYIGETSIPGHGSCAYGSLEIKIGK